MMRLILTGLAAMAAMAPATASADTGEPVWTCRASAGYIDERLPAPFGPRRLEPVLANGEASADPALQDRPQCVDDRAGFPQVLLQNQGQGNPPPPGRLTLQAPYAETAINPDLGPAREQTATSRTGIADPAEVILTDGEHSLVVRAEAVTAQATATCDGTNPVLTGSSKVVNLTINGQPIQIPADQSKPTVINVSPLARVTLNEQQISGDASSADQALIQRAVHVELFPTGLPPAEAGKPLVEAVLAEAKVDRHGATCATPPPPPCPEGTTREGEVCVKTVPVPGPPGTNTTTNTTTTQGSPNDNTQVRGSEACPAGSRFDPQSRRCVIRDDGRTIVVSRPGEGPTGGRVIPLDDARKRFGNQPCLRGQGPGFAIIGTNKADRITGTNRTDRILTLGGNDRVEGGRGNDCVQGGTGVDVLSGALGRDRLYGQQHRDHLIGGSNSDVLIGASGNDTINAGYGRDRVSGGSGRDYINAATAGPPSERLDCGSGPDKLRINRNERRRHRGCEIVYVIR